MNLPKTFKLAGTTWRVLVVEHMQNSGETHVNDAIIKINNKLPPEGQMQTFLHQLLHAVQFTMGNLGDHDEKEIDATAHMLHQFLTTYK